MLRESKNVLGARIVAAALIAAALWVTSCAYYNTFFFAKKYYREAERARDLRTEDKASSQEIQDYEKCIQQCSKVMADYPNSKYVDDALFLTANSYYWWGRYVDAIKWYGQLEERCPDSEYIPEAHLMTARCHVALREYVEAEGILSKLLKSPGTKNRDTLLYTLAELYAGRGDEDQAISRLKKLIKEYPSSPLRLDGMMALGDAYVAKSVYDSAATSYEAVAKGSGDKDQRIEARKRMGHALYASGDAQGAMDIYTALLRTVEVPVTTKNRVRDPQEATLVLRIGECDNALGNHERALEMFQRVMTDFPSTTSAAEAEFLTGYTYEIYYEDLDRAKTSYDRVPSHSQQSIFVGEAKRRSEGLGKLGEYLKERDAAKEGGSQDEAAKGLFLSAELDLFDLNKPEAALDLYRQVTRDFPDSPYAPKAAYAAAWVLVNKLNKKEEGMDEYRRILLNYPYTEYADGARRILGMVPLAALWQGPPLPEGWTPADSSAGAEGPQGPGLADSSAMSGGVGAVAGMARPPGGGSTADTTGAMALGPGLPDSVSGSGRTPTDTTAAPPDSAGPRMTKGSEPPRWPGTGGAPADTTKSGAGTAGGGGSPHSGGSPADTTGHGTGGRSAGQADSTKSGASRGSASQGDSAGPAGGDGSPHGSGSPADSTGHGTVKQGAGQADSTGSGQAGQPAPGRQTEGGS